MDKISALMELVYSLIKIFLVVLLNNKAKICKFKSRFFSDAICPLKLSDIFHSSSRG